MRDKDIILEASLLELVKTNPNVSKLILDTFEIYKNEFHKIKTNIFKIRKFVKFIMWFNFIFCGIICSIIPVLREHICMNIVTFFFHIGLDLVLRFEFIKRLEI